MSGAEAPVRAGDILAGKYRVEKVLGAGAMGVVVAATHVDLLEVRAIKFMLPSMLGEAENVERFLREARAAVRLKSQHVAKIHDVGRLETGAPYIVMEHLQGSDLKTLLDARGVLPVAEAARYLIQVCEALTEAHALGIVHRDLKPANLFLTTGPTGAPCIKVLDFGIAKMSGGQGPAVDMTSTTALLGTPLYMSPEQMRSTRNVDARSDLWALGVILYRMLTGRTPFVGSSVTEICAAVVGDQPDPPAALRPDVSPPLAAIVMRLLEKSPAKRYASAAELSAALAPFAEGRAPLPAAAAPSGPAPLGRTVAMDISPQPAAGQPAALQAAAPPAPPQPAASGAPGTLVATRLSPGPSARPTPGAARTGVVVAVGLALALAGGAFVAMRGLGHGLAAPLPAPASVAPTVEAPSSDALATVAPTSVPTAAPTSTAAAVAEPPASAERPHAGRPLPRPASYPTLPPLPTPTPYQAPTPAPRRDAFGNDRK
jgi:tRNA A-37 threonylcarbamoyl transferase component Bud32